ncbi:MAG: L,D-transpeptidase [Acidobacteria bacterium]|nr:L,D-transpeptidase [Acidobacteriota bacterium]
MSAVLLLLAPGVSISIGNAWDDADGALRNDRSFTLISHSVEPGPASAKELTARFTTEQLALLEKLNRSDAAHMARLKALVVPDRWDLPEVAYSPLPLTYNEFQGYPKALVVYLPGQVFGAYEYGMLARWGPISSGAASNPTPEGLFHLNWKSPGRHSTDNAEWYMRWYFNFDNRAGRAFHAYSLPGHPASHTCVRLLSRDALWLYDWGESWTLDERGWNVLHPGTPVLIVGQYQFDAPPPWHSPEWLEQHIALPDFANIW